MSESRTRVIATSPKGGYLYVDADVCHTHECPFWRMGKSHGPCECGAEELREHWGYETALDAALGSEGGIRPSARIAFLELKIREAKREISRIDRHRNEVLTALSDISHVLCDPQATPAEACERVANILDRVSAVPMPAQDPRP